MKKSILIALSIGLIAGTMSSCGKSSKGKMEGIWTVDGSTSKYSVTNGGSTSGNTTVISGATVTYTETSGGTSTTMNGVVNEASMTIGKDGTWSTKRNVTYTQTIFSITYTTNIITTTSGNWDFLDGVGDNFKGKERVAFYTLNWNETETNSNSGGSSITTTSSEVFKNTDNSMVFVITESKNKSLVMNSEGGGTSNGGTVTTTSESYTLSQD